MKLSVRAATMVVVAILMMAMVAPSATAVAPGKWDFGPRVGCRSFVTSSHYLRVNFILKNDRNQRTTVHGRWHVYDDSRIDETFRHHAELATGEREVFTHIVGHPYMDEPTVDRLDCRESS